MPYKDLATRIQTQLAEYSFTLKRAYALQTVAAMHGAKDWNTLSRSPLPLVSGARQVLVEKLRQYGAPEAALTGAMTWDLGADAGLGTPAQAEVTPLPQTSSDYGLLVDALGSRGGVVTAAVQREPVRLSLLDAELGTALSAL